MSAPRFDDKLYANAALAVSAAQSLSNLSGSPVIVLYRDGWYAISENPPDDEEFFPDGTPYVNGWSDHALVDPQDDTDASL